MELIFPPHSPGWFVTPPSLIRGIPSLYQLNLTGGLLELESQKRLASAPAVNAFGSIRIFKVSGKTAKEGERKISFGQVKRRPSRRMRWTKNIIMMTTTRVEKERKKIKVFLCFVRKSKEKLPIEPNNQARESTRRSEKRKISNSCGSFQLQKI